MPKIRLNTKALAKLQKQKGWDDGELCKQIGIDRAHLWRLRLPADDPRYNAPGEIFIAGTLKAFSEKSFEELFFLDNNIAGPKLGLSNK